MDLLMKVYLVRYVLHTLALAKLGLYVEKARFATLAFHSAPDQAYRLKYQAHGCLILP